MSREAHNRLDLTGQRFGSVTVIRPVKTSYRGVHWEVRCDCGKTSIKVAAILRTRPPKFCTRCRPRPAPVSAYRKAQKLHFVDMFEKVGTLYSQEIEGLEPWDVETCEPTPTALAPVCPFCESVTEDARTLKSREPLDCDFCGSLTYDAVACQDCHAVLCPSCNLAR